jgi:competence protein ComEC
MPVVGLGMLGGAWLVLHVFAPLPAWLAPGMLLVAVAAACRGRWLLAGLGFGITLAAVALDQGLAQRLDPALDGQRLALVGVVDDLPRREQRRVVVTLRLEQPAGLRGRLRLSWYEAHALPAPGERWRFEAKVQRPRGLLNTGSSSREAWLLRQGITVTGYASGDAAGQRLDVAADRLLRWRGRAASRIDEIVGDPEAAAVLTAITLGFRGGLDAGTRDALAATGTGHLLAISGLHVGLVAGAGGFAAGGLARRVTRGRRPARDWAALGALLGAAVYCVFAGMPVSARRALLMTAVALGALLCRRGGSVPAALGLALALVLATDPLAVLDPGLWLSFGAVATIIAAVAGRRASPGLLPAALRIQAALAVGMLVCTVAWFGRISLVAPLANLLAVPWFSLFVVPPALAGVALSWVLPAVGTAALLFAAEATAQGLVVIERVAAWPWAAHAPAAPGAMALLLAAVGAAWSLAPRPAPGRWCAALLFAPLLLPGTPSLAPGAFELRVFDIGHGLAVLVRTRDHALLYDAGPAWPGGDAAAWSVLPALRALGLRRLDRMVLSHGHADHAGGAATVQASFPGTPVVGGHGTESVASRRCPAGAAWAWNGVRFTLLHPEPGFRGGTNDGSCVLLVEGAGGRALLTGDIEARGERALLRWRARLPVDVVVAPHHGSNTSSGPALVAATGPAWVVFSTNWKNRWGFPAAPVLARWQSAGATLLSTERHGEIVLRFAPAGPAPPVLRRRQACRPWLDCPGDGVRHAAAPAVTSALPQP